MNGVNIIPRQSHVIIYRYDMKSGKHTRLIDRGGGRSFSRVVSGRTKGIFSK